jgi:hypothetical protein
MSLRIFHIIFVSACVLLSLFVGLWGVRQANFMLALVFFPTAVALAYYGRRVAVKLKGLP